MNLFLVCNTVVVNESPFSLYYSITLQADFSEVHAGLSINS